MLIQPPSSSGREFQHAFLFGISFLRLFKQPLVVCFCVHFYYMTCLGLHLALLCLIMLLVWKGVIVKLLSFRRSRGTLRSRVALSSPRGWAAEAGEPVGRWRYGPRCVVGFGGCRPHILPPYPFLLSRPSFFCFRKVTPIQESVTEVPFSMALEFRLTIWCGSDSWEVKSEWEEFPLKRKTQEERNSSQARILSYCDICTSCLHLGNVLREDRKWLVGQISRDGSQLQITGI